MSEREEMARIIWASDGPDCDAMADEILAAGYRRIPDDCVVVRREDVEWCIFGFEDSTGYGEEGDFDVTKRLKAALTATRPDKE